MYIESWQVAVVLIWLIYLLYRTSVWSNKVQLIINQYEELLKRDAREKYRRTQDLVRIILKFNKEILKKAPQKTRDSILEDEAIKIICSLRYTNQGNYDMSEAVIIDDIFGVAPSYVSKYDGEERMNIVKTKQRLVKRLIEMMDEELPS